MSVTVQATLSRLCESAGMGAFCSSVALDDMSAQELSKLSSHVMRIERGSPLWQPGDPADALLRIRTGALKSTQGGATLAACVTGLWLAGDLVGLDAFYSGWRTNTLAALVPTEVECISMIRLTADDIQDKALTAALMKLLSQELLRREQQLLVIRAASEQRVALFLVALLARSHTFDKREAVNLYMSRREIAAFLGLRPETVTRRLRDLHYSGVIKLSGRQLIVREWETLAREAGLVKDDSQTAIGHEEKETTAS